LLFTRSATGAQHVGHRDRSNHILRVM